MPANLFIPISLTQYLTITGQGAARNVSFSVPATTQVSDINNPVQPDSNDYAVLIDNIEFDGIQSGMVGYNLELDGGNVIAGFAIQGKDVLQLLCVGALRYQIQNNASTSCLVNIDFVTLDRNTYNQLVKVINNMVALPSAMPYA